MNCLWNTDDPTAPGTWVCLWCERPTSPKRFYDTPPKRQCSNAPDLRPAADRLAEQTGDLSIVDKLAHYAVALGLWAIAGFPSRTPDEVAAIYAEHCRPCEKHDPVSDACGICGCNVRTDGAPVRNKIAMGTEHCPLEKW